MEASFSIGKKIRENLREMRFGLLELSGSLGDLGTFIPLTVTVAYVTGMDIGVILIFAGIFNVISGLIFGLPIPVQPMKAIAAVAIAEQLLPAEIAAAGLAVGLILIIMSMTGLVEKIERLIPLSVVRGIQLGIGVKLAIKGIEFIADKELFGLDSIAAAIGLGFFALLFYNSKKIPIALILLAVGVCVTFLKLPSGISFSTYHIPNFVFLFPDASQWVQGILRGAVPQLPLTLLNSVIAVCALSTELFPKKKLSANKVAYSVGLMNLLSCGFGAFPMCHGSGGLAGQYHFGARTGGSVMMLGLGKITIGIILGSTAMQFLYYFPSSVLGVLLFFAGLQLSLPARDQKTVHEFSVMIITMVGILAVNSLVGVLLGISTYLLFHMISKKKY